MLKNKKTLLLVSIGIIMILGFTIGFGVISNKKVVTEPTKVVTKEMTFDDESTNSKLDEEEKLYELSSR